MKTTRRQFALGAATLAASLGLPGTSVATDPPQASGSTRYEIWFWKNSWVKWFGSKENQQVAYEFGMAERDALIAANGTEWKEEGKIEVRHLYAEGGLASSKIRNGVGGVVLRQLAGGNWQYGVTIKAVKYNKKPDGMPITAYGIEDFDDIYDHPPSPTSW